MSAKLPRALEWNHVTGEAEPVSDEVQTALEASYGGTPFGMFLAGDAVALQKNAIRRRPRPATFNDLFEDAVRKYGDAAREARARMLQDVGERPFDDDWDEFELYEDYEAAVLQEERARAAAAIAAHERRVERDFAWARRVRVPTDFLEDAMGDVLESLVTGELDPVAYRRVVISWAVRLVRLTMLFLWKKYVTKKLPNRR